MSVSWQRELCNKECELGNKERVTAITVSFWQREGGFATVAGGATVEGVAARVDGDGITHK